MRLNNNIFSVACKIQLCERNFLKIYRLNFYQLDIIVYLSVSFIYILFMENSRICGVSIAVFTGGNACWLNGN